MVLKVHEQTFGGVAPLRNWQKEISGPCYFAIDMDFGFTEFLRYRPIEGKCLEVLAVRIPTGDAAEDFALVQKTRLPVDETGAVVVTSLTNRTAKLFNNKEPNGLTITAKAFGDATRKAMEFIQQKD